MEEEEDRGRITWLQGFLKVSFTYSAITQKTHARWFGDGRRFHAKILSGNQKHTFEWETHPPDINHAHSSLDKCVRARPAHPTSELPNAISQGLEGVGRIGRRSRVGGKYWIET